MHSKEGEVGDSVKDIHYRKVTLRGLIGASSETANMCKQDRDWLGLRAFLNQVNLDSVSGEGRVNVMSFVSLSGNL